MFMFKVEVCTVVNPILIYFLLFSQITLLFNTFFQLTFDRAIILFEKTIIFLIITVCFLKISFYDFIVIFGIIYEILNLDLYYLYWFIYCLYFIYSYLLVDFC